MLALGARLTLTKWFRALEGHYSLPYSPLPEGSVLLRDSTCQLEKEG